MNTLTLLLASLCLSLPVVVLAAEPASAVSEESAHTSAAQAADQTAKQPAADIQADKAASKSPAPDASNKDAASDKDAAADQDDTSAPGNKVPSPADVAKRSTGKGTPQRFTPSEQVRPDFDVSFPIDI
jgi:hypothetical protein